MRSGVRATARNSFSSPCPPPTRRTPATPRVRCARRLTKRTPHVAPNEAARCRHVGQAARIAMPSALQAGRPVRRVGMSPLSRDPPARLLQTPNAFQLACRSRKASSEAFPGDRPRCRLCSGFGKLPGGSYPNRHSSRHSADKTPDLPCRPTPDFCRNPGNGICRQKSGTPYKTPCS